jgi:DNA polymerase elongation subunit (family B)
MCGSHRFRFLKEPKGLIPSLLENLLSSRKRVNADIKTLKETLKETKDQESRKQLTSKITSLDKRQLAMKVSANSMYGTFGTRRGYLPPFMPGAMCTTARGRESIEKAATHLQKYYSANLIYGDTDSCYINFPQFKTEADAKECFLFCKQIEEEMLSLFPRPMKLAYEEKIYWRFFILTKKRYMALQCSPEGIISNNIFKRGVLLSRRDTNRILRKIYSELMLKIFHKDDRDKVLEFLVEEINAMFMHTHGNKEFITTKSVGRVEDYKIRPLPDDEKRKAKRLKDLKCTEQEYILKALPAHAQLAEKMKRRGKRVEPGTRLEYVITQEGGYDGKLFEKMEDYEYFAENSDILSIDYFYYLKLFINPIDEAIHVAYGLKDFVKSQYNYRLMREKILEKIKTFGKPKIVLL